MPITLFIITCINASYHSSDAPQVVYDQQNQMVSTQILEIEMTYRRLIGWKSELAEVNFGNEILLIKQRITTDW